MTQISLSERKFLSDSPHLVYSHRCHDLESCRLDLEGISSTSKVQIQPCSEVFWVDVLGGDFGGDPIGLVGSGLQ